jgi:hypothetical protein
LLRGQDRVVTFLPNFLDLKVIPYPLEDAVGSRSAFSAGFTGDLAEVWVSHGNSSMLYTAEKQPAVFFATCARVLPNDVRVTVEQSLPGNLSMEDWQVMREIIAAVRQTIPDASSKPPGAVLEHVLGALRAAQAKPIELSE